MAVRAHLLGLSMCCTHTGVLYCWIRLACFRGCAYDSRLVQSPATDRRSFQLALEQGDTERTRCVGDFRLQMSSDSGSSSSSSRFML